MNSPCPVCAVPVTNFRRQLKVNKDYVYTVCGNCQSFVLDPLPTSSEIKELYAGSEYFQDLYGDHYFSIDKARTKNFSRWFQWVRKYLPSKDLRLVEIGSGSGALLQVFKDSGYTNFVGYEMNAQAIQECRSRGLPVLNQDLFQNEKDVDAIFMFDVIEHVTDPADFLASLRDQLKPGGLLVLVTSCNQRLTSRMLGRFWWFLIPPHHTIIFNIKSLEGLLSRVDYRVMETLKINYHWLTLSNGVARVWNRFPQFQFRGNSFLELTKNFVFPFYHFMSFLTLAQKRSRT